MQTCKKAKIGKDAFPKKTLLTQALNSKNFSYVVKISLVLV